MIGLVAGALALAAVVAGMAHAEPVRWGAPHEPPITGEVVQMVHAAGAQIYECQPAAGGQSRWTLREPVATLMSGGKTLGRHYRSPVWGGPVWELTDGSAVQGAIEETWPAATSKDLPWLRLAVLRHVGSGVLTAASAVMRINTRGGVLQGACAAPGEIRAEPYSADYVFLRPPATP